MKTNDFPEISQNTYNWNETSLSPRAVHLVLNQNIFKITLKSNSNQNFFKKFVVYYYFNHNQENKNIFILFFVLKMMLK